MLDTIDFDPAFYRHAYSDLGLMSDEELRDHYATYGFTEGRFRSRDSLDAYMESVGDPIPPHFDPLEYLRLNPDVADNITHNWEAFNHYSRHGAKEGRLFTTFDLNFYCDLYHAGNPISRAEAWAELRSCPPQARRFHSMEQLLQAHGYSDAAWLDLFSPREFYLLNFSWVTRELNRAQAVALFLQSGIERLAPISFVCQFDPNFFREMHPTLATLNDRNLYEHWLKHSATEEDTFSPRAWLLARDLELSCYPSSFSWQGFAQSYLPQLEVSAPGARWQALAHLLNLKQALPAIENAIGGTASDFLVAIGKYLERANNENASIMVFEAAKRLDGLSVSRLLGDSYHQAGQHRAAVQCYAQAVEARFHDVWLVARLAASHAALGDLRSACQALLVDGAAFRGQQPWDQAFRTVVNQHFAVEAQRARGAIAAGRRTDGDQILETVTREIEQWLREGLNLPVELPLAPSKRVVLLGVTALRQCKHYRIDQKKEHLKSLGYQLDVFALEQVSSFIQAIPGACAAIFYRVIANPEVIEAIITADAQGLATFYDIDDLIFDPQVYPDPYDTFQQAISPAEYNGLIFGTTLHRQAMAMCRLGLASTPALVEYVADVVRDRQCFLIRNALDSNILAEPRKINLYPDGPSNKVSIVYGSGTLSHSKDFNDIAVAAILPLMHRRPDVHLVIIGYLELDDRFLEVTGRVHRIDPIYDLLTYYSVLASCDINLATLTNTVPNNAKSEIKWMEAAVLGVPSIVSATRSLCEVIDHGVTGYLARSTEDWIEALELLTADAACRREVGNNARNQVLANYEPTRAAATLADALGLNKQFTQRPLLPSRKKRALVVNVFFPPQSIGGATRVVADLISEWQKSAAGDWEFAVATTDFDCPVSYKRALESWNTVPVFRIAPPLIDNLDWQPLDAKMGKWFSDVLKLYQPDVVHFHCIQRLTASVVQACIQARIPFVVSAHDGWWLSDYQFLFDEHKRPRAPDDELLLGVKPGLTMAQSLDRKNILRPLLKAAYAIVTPSLDFQRLYQGAGFDHVVAISNGLPEINVQPRVPSPNGKVRIGHIGDISPHKGFDLVEAALRQGRYEHIELFGVSHAWSGGQELKLRWGASDVTLMSRVPQDEVAQLYAQLDVIVAPSACVESFGLVTREANAAGLWVVASNRGAIGEDVRPGIDGFVIDVSGPQELAEVFKTINADPDYYRASVPTRSVLSIKEQAAITLDLLVRCASTSLAS